MERNLLQERNCGRAVLKDLEDSQSMINANLRDEIHNLQSEQTLILNAIRRQGLVEPLLQATRGRPNHMLLYKQLTALASGSGGRGGGSGGGLAGADDSGSVLSNGHVDGDDDDDDDDEGDVEASASRLVAALVASPPRPLNGHSGRSRQEIRLVEGLLWAWVGRVKQL